MWAWPDRTWAIENADGSDITWARGIVGAVVLVDITPRMEFQGARRVVSFMAAHPDGFGTLDEAADVIAAYNPHRARPDNVDGLRKVLQQRHDGRWFAYAASCPTWSPKPPSTSSNNWSPTPRLSTCPAPVT